MREFDVCIPTWAESKVVSKALHSLASCWGSEHLHIYLCNDCSPNTDCNYQDLVDKFKGILDITVIKNETNCGQGVSRDNARFGGNSPWVVFMDNDDCYSPAFFKLVDDAITQSKFMKNPKGEIKVDDFGKPIENPDALPVALVSCPLYAIGEKGSYTIPSSVSPWENSKVWNREFLNKYNLRHNPLSSFHSEDYEFLSKCEYCLMNDSNYQTLFLHGDGSQFYIWFDNSQSQSRRDEFYGEFLTSFTTRSSSLVLKFIYDNKHLCRDFYNFWHSKVLNSCVYAYHSFMSVLFQVKHSNWIMKENEWYMLRDSIDDLLNFYEEENQREEFTEFEKEDMSEQVRHRTDAQQKYNQKKPDFTFLDFSKKNIPYLKWTYEDLKNSKDKKGDIHIYDSPSGK